MKKYLMQVEITADTQASQGDVATFVENVVGDACNSLIRGRRLFPRKIVGAKVVGGHMSEKEEAPA